jgi:phosphate acetyltransferase
LAKKTFLLVPVHPGSGLTTVSLGMVRAFDRLGARVAFFKPVGQTCSGDHGPERSTHFIRATTHLQPSPPIPLEQAERMMSEHQRDALMSQVIENFHQSTLDADVVVVE